MSIGSLGVIGSLTATPLPQKTAETDKTVREATDEARETEAARAAEAASGIGQTEEDSQAAERDADGRRLWERSAKPPAGEAKPEAPADSQPLAKDPSGEAGGAVDLLG
jgi:hypothetical protein